MISILQKACRAFNYELVPEERAREQYFAGHIPYLKKEEREIIEKCLPYTQIGRENLFSLLRAVAYVVRNKIPGSFVECGVWKGGAVMAMGLVAELLNDPREIFLFDTFMGMPASGSMDVDFEGHDEAWYRKYGEIYCRTGAGVYWNRVGLEDVKQSLEALSLYRVRYHYVEGRVEDTLPDRAPTEIALLRLDTDFYESTKHELVHLIPRLSTGGVLIVDDYGHFLGARKAVDEYFDAHDIRWLMHRSNYTTIIGIKTS